MPYQTDERLKSYLDTNQLFREQMCLAVLSIDKRFSELRPRHPRGGPDGGRDIDAIYKDNQSTYAAVGFVNQANDSEEQKRRIRRKFTDDISTASSAEEKIEVFVFMTNLNMTAGEKDDMTLEARQAGFLYCDIFDRERIRILLDSPDGFSIRFQYLGIPLSLEEQASFFAKWGDGIQSIVSSGFQRIEKILDRVLFLQEAEDALVALDIIIELDRDYSSDEIGHARLFCQLLLKEPKHGILCILFGSTDKNGRQMSGVISDHEQHHTGLSHGVVGGQWESYLSHKEDSTAEQSENNKPRWESSGSSMSIGADVISKISIRYNRDSFIRIGPILKLKDIDNAMFLILANNTLADKIAKIDIFANGYKLQEFTKINFTIDRTELSPQIPMDFSHHELNDPWVCIRPSNYASAFRLSFFEHTPRRLF